MTSQPSKHSKSEGSDNLPDVVMQWIYSFLDLETRLWMLYMSKRLRVILLKTFAQSYVRTWKDLVCFDTSRVRHLNERCDPDDKRLIYGFYLKTEVTSKLGKGTGLAVDSWIKRRMFMSAALIHQVSSQLESMRIQAHSLCIPFGTFTNLTQLELRGWNPATSQDVHSRCSNVYPLFPLGQIAEATKLVKLTVEADSFCALPESTLQLWFGSLRHLKQLNLVDFKVRASILALLGSQQQFSQLKQFSSTFNEEKHVWELWDLDLIFAFGEGFPNAQEIILTSCDFLEMALDTANKIKTGLEFRFQDSI